MAETRRKLPMGVIWTSVASVLAGIGLIASGANDAQTLAGYFPATRGFVEDQLKTLRNEYAVQLESEAQRTQRALDQLRAEMLESRIEALALSIEQLENQYIDLDTRPAEEKTADLRIRLVSLRRQIDVFKNMLEQHKQELRELQARLRERLAGVT